MLPKGRKKGKVNGSVSDADIERETTAAHTADPSVPVRTRAEESDLTTDRLNWVLGATIGVKFSKQLAIAHFRRDSAILKSDFGIALAAPSVCASEAGAEGEDGGYGHGHPQRWDNVITKNYNYVRVSVGKTDTMRGHPIGSDIDY